MIGRLLGIIKLRQRIDIHAARVNSDAILLRTWFFDKDVLDVVDHIVCYAHRAVNRRSNIVAVIDLIGLRRLVVRIVRITWVIRRTGNRGHDQVEIVDQLDGRVGVAWRVGPCQRETYRVMERVRAKCDLPRTTLVGGQGVGQALVDETNWPGILIRRVLIGQRRRSPLQVRETPALVVDRAADVVVVPGIYRLRAVDQ